MKRKPHSSPLRGLVLFAVIIVFLFGLAAAGCSSMRMGASAYSGAMETYAEPAPEMGRSAMKAAAPAVMMSETAAADDALMPEEDGSSGSASSPGARKRIYNGSAGLVVEDPPDVRTRLEEMAIECGGYVEQSWAEYLVFRVPAAQFAEVFNAVLELGKIRYRQIDTWDVTDQYQDVTARLATAEKTRSRLYDLLEESTDPEERAKILREIGRLTEEIESIRQQLQILDSRIAFSRISVELIPRLQDEYRRDDIPFEWIASLSPLYPVSRSLKAAVKLDPGEDFAVFGKEKYYAAEDAFGGSITVSTVENSPLGDGAFWQKALYHHLHEYYASAERRSLRFGDKAMPGVEFVSKDREPFRYFVGMVVDGKRIHVVELFAPDAAAFDSLYTVLEEGVCR